MILNKYEFFFGDSESVFKLRRGRWGRRRAVTIHPCKLHASDDTNVYYSKHVEYNCIFHCSVIFTNTAIKQMSGITQVHDEASLSDAAGTVRRGVGWWLGEGGRGALDAVVLRSGWRVAVRWVLRSGVAMTEAMMVRERSQRACFGAC